MAGYLLAIAAGCGLALRLTIGCEVLAVAMVALLITGIHNAWDITLWAIARRNS